MLRNQLLAGLFIGSLALFLTGCCGFPGPCGPGTCGGDACGGGSCGPVAFGNICGDGCGECEGCGELYIDPWINHPADACDPCDCCGNHNGQSCGKCRSVFDGVASLWGYRCGDQGCGCGDTSCGGDCGTGFSCGDGACGGGDCLACNTDSHINDTQITSRNGGSHNDSEVYISGEPTPSGNDDIIVESQPSQTPYKPHRERKIFRAKPEFAGRSTERPSRR